MLYYTYIQKLLKRGALPTKRGGATKNLNAVSIEKCAALTLEEMNTLLIKMTFQSLSRPSSDIKVLIFSGVSAAHFSTNITCIYQM